MEVEFVVKYKLLKDLPGLKAGAIFKESKYGYHSENYYSGFKFSDVENNQEWFEEIKDGISWEGVTKDLNIILRIKKIRY